MADDWIPQPKPDTPTAQLEQDFSAAIVAADQAKIYRNLVPQIAKLPAGQDIYFKTRMAKAFGKDFRASDWNTAIRGVRSPGPRPVLASDTPNPLDSLIVSEEGSPRAILANAIILLRHHPDWRGVLAFDEFAYRPMTLKPPPWSPAPVEEWTDNHDVLAADWLQHHGVLVNSNISAQAVQAVSQSAYFHPVRDYLDKLKWDGKKRIDSWLTTYLGVTASNYTYAVGPRWLISAIARIYRPGVKADHCLIFEGVQGKKKSTALEVLGSPWFADEIADMGSKDAAMQTQGVWILEIAELDTLSRSEVSSIKAFISRTTDRFRPPYGHRIIKSPRSCVFAGSVNLNTYLRDETGARRFWPVKADSIDIDKLRTDRDQLWAEARDRYRSGSPWWLENQGLVDLATVEQSDRFEEDAWQEKIEDYAVGKESLSVVQVLEFCIQKPTKDWTQLERNRVARILRAMGWVRYNARTDAGREWRYARVCPVKP